MAAFFAHKLASLDGVCRNDRIFFRKALDANHFTHLGPTVYPDRNIGTPYSRQPMDEQLASISHVDFCTLIDPGNNKQKAWPFEPDESSKAIDDESLALRSDLYA
jgi:hypothetical protein